MKKTIFEEMGGTYIRHEDYSRGYQKVTYIDLLIRGTRNSYFTEIDKHAEDKYLIIAIVA